RGEEPAHVQRSAAGDVQVDRGARHHHRPRWQSRAGHGATLERLQAARGARSGERARGRTLRSPERARGPRRELGAPPGAVPVPRGRALPDPQPDRKNVAAARQPPSPSRQRPVFPGNPSVAAQRLRPVTNRETPKRRSCPLYFAEESFMKSQLLAGLALVAGTSLALAQGPVTIKIGPQNKS